MSKRTIIAPESTKRPVVECDGEETPVKNSNEDVTSPEHERALLRQAQRQKFVTLADQLAESTFYFRNYKYQDADKLFPKVIDVDQRIAGKCYPYAKRGMLLVDEVTNAHQWEKMKVKHAVLREKGFRHVIIRLDKIKIGNEVHEMSDMIDCLTQLGED